MEWTRGTEIRVGLFVAIGIALFIVTLLVIGAERNQFEGRVYYKVALPNAAGLGRGTSVRMAGLGAGQIEQSKLPDDLGRKRVVIVLWVKEEMATRVRRDSRARIGTKGMLGDKQLEITPGSRSQPILPEWSFIPAAEGGAGGVLEVAEATLQEVHATVKQVQKAVQPLADPRFTQDLRDTASEVHALTRAVRDGEGTMHKLFYDRETANKLDRTLDSLAQMAGDIRRTTSTVSAIAQEIQSGDGTAHALIYGQEGRDALAGIAVVSRELATLSRDIRTNDGLLHSVIYTQEQRSLLDNLTEASAGVRAIVADLRAGRGTVGALLADPSVYEDIKRVIGNVGRSRVLRALVRYAITEDDTERPRARVHTVPADGNGNGRDAGSGNGTAP